MNAHEQKLDAATAAKLDAEREEAAIRNEIASMKARATSTDDPLWREIEKREAKWRRAQVVLANAQRREVEAQLAAEQAQLADAERAHGALLAAIHPATWHDDDVEPVARALLPHALLMQKEIDHIEDLAHERWSRQARAVALAKKLGSSRTAGRERTLDEWLVAIGYRVAQLAHEQGVELRALPFEAPIALEERRPGAFERAVTTAAPPSVIESSCAAAKTWAECERQWPRETSNEKEENSHDQFDSTAAE